MEMTPQNKYIAIHRLDADDRTLGGIYLPEETQKKAKPQRGIVIAVCEPFVDDDGRKWKSRFAASDRVFFPKYAGEELSFPDGTKIVFMKEVEILAAARDVSSAEPSLTISAEAFTQAATVSVLVPAPQPVPNGVANGVNGVEVHTPAQPAPMFLQYPGQPMAAAIPAHMEHWRNVMEQERQPKPKKTNLWGRLTGRSSR